MIIEIEQLQQQLNKQIKQQQQRNKTNSLLLKQSRIKNKMDVCIPKQLKQVTNCHNCPRYKIDGWCDTTTEINKLLLKQSRQHKLTKVDLDE